MPTINVQRFLGISPKTGATLLGATQAQLAKNSKLWSQTLRPFDGLGSAEVLGKTTGDIQTIYRFNATTWLCWTQDVNVVRGPIANDALEKTYFTGTDTPRVTTNTLFDDGTPGTSLPPASYILGIPAPSTAPVATDVGAGAITATVDYQFTFVRKWSDGTADEGPPSPVSNSLVLAAKQTSVTLPNGTMTVPGDYGITHKRLYRLNGALRYFVAEVAIATTPYADNIATTALGSAITTVDYLPCPDGMVGLIALPNGIMAGFKDNVVYLSEPYRPWTYPAANQYVVNWPMVAIGNMLTSIVVATTAFPFVGRGVDPAAYTFRLYPGLLPCVSKRSMKGSDVGVFWASTGGIAGFDGSGCALVTREFLTRKEWNDEFAPTTLHASIFDGRYYAWYTTATAGGTKLGGGIVLDRGEPAFLTTLGEYVYAAAVIPNTDAMLVVKQNPIDSNKNYIYQWEANLQSPYVYEWKSKVFVAPGADNFGWAQIIGDFEGGLSAAEIAALNAEIAVIQAANAALTSTDGPIDGFAINDGPMGGDNYTQAIPSTEFIAGAVSFKYWADGVLRLTKDIYSSEPFALPSGFLAERHEFQVSGAVEITSVTLSTTVEELAQV